MSRPPLNVPDVSSDVLRGIVGSSDLQLPNIECVDDDEPTKEEDKLLDTVRYKRQTTKEVLVYIDKDRRKIVRLYENDDLETKVLRSIKDDSSLKHLTKDIKLITFQAFSTKFKKWVDFDQSDEVYDGQELKVVFVKKNKHGKSGHKSKRSHKSRKRSRSTSSEIDDMYDQKKQYKVDCAYSEHETPEMVSNKHQMYEHITDCSSDLNHSSLELETKLECNKEKKSARCEGIVHDTMSSDTQPGRSDTVSSTQANVKPASEGEVYRISLGLVGKTPVSALHELCSRLKWGEPVFEVEDCFVGRSPHFLGKVVVKGKTYTAPTRCTKKKVAKQDAALHCLKQLGVF